MEKPTTKTPEMSSTICLDRLMREFSREVAGCIKHAEKIDNFGLALAPFNGWLSLSVSIHDDHISLMASIIGDHTPVMLRMIQAGFDIGEPQEHGSRHPSKKSWKAAVHTLDVDFFLYFDTTIDAQEVL